MEPKKRKTKKGNIQSKEQRYKNIVLTGVILVVVAGGFIFLKGNKQDSIVDKDRIPTQLPDFADAMHWSSEAYTVAIKYPELLEKIACYCGCVDMRHEGAKPIQHKNTRDCFINDDGTFDEHAAYCELCNYIALDAYDMYSRGMPIKDIRSVIDSKYGNGKYGPGTNTPPVV